MFVVIVPAAANNTTKAGHSHESRGVAGAGECTVEEGSKSTGAEPMVERGARRIAIVSQT